MTGVKSAARTLDLLELVSAHRGGLTFSQVQQGLGVPKSSASALLQQLLDAGYLAYDPDARRYEPGLGMLRLASRFLAGSDLLGDLTDLTRTTTRTLGMTSHAAILDGTEVVYLAKSEAGPALSLMNRTGVRMPAHCTAVGKALLGELDDAEVGGRYGHGRWERLTARSLASPDALLDELAGVRAAGYAREDRETSEYAACLAVPVRQHGAVVAALSVTLPAADFAAADHEGITATLRSLAGMLGDRTPGGPAGRG